MNNVRNSISYDNQTREQLLNSIEKEKFIARLIDGTCLASDAIRGDIEDLSILACKERIRAVCVAPVYLRDLARDDLKRDDIEIATVVNFPNGYQYPETIFHEVESAIRDGATEIDFVQPLYHVKNRDWRRLEQFTQRLVDSFPNVLFKVILETGLLSIAELQTCVRCHALAGAHIIKTSTGFSVRGASVSDVQTIRNTLQSMGLGDHIGIKASGKVTTQAQALALIEAGATRIGTSKVSKLIYGD